MIKDAIKAVFRERIRQSIIDTVNTHQQFIAAWKKESFRQRAAIEPKNRPHRKRFAPSSRLRSYRPRLKLPPLNE